MNDENTHRRRWWPRVKMKWRQKRYFILHFFSSHSLDFWVEEFGQAKKCVDTSSSVNWNWSFWLVSLLTLLWHIHQKLGTSVSPLWASWQEPRSHWCPHSLSPENTHNPWLMWLINFSSTLSCDFRSLTVISDDLRVISHVFVKLSQEKTLWKK